MDRQNRVNKKTKSVRIGKKVSNVSGRFGLTVSTSNDGIRPLRGCSSKLSNYYKLYFPGQRYSFSVCLDTLQMFSRRLEVMLEELHLGKANPEENGR